MSAGMSTPPMTFDPQELRRIFSRYPSGVVALAGLVNDAPVGLAASSFTSVSLDPPLVSVCIAQESTTWPVLRGAPSIGISVLAASHHREGRQLAARNADRFARVAWHRGEHDAVLLHGAAATMCCSILREVPAGDHLVVLLQVQAINEAPHVEPLVFHASRFRGLHDTDAA